MSQIKTTAIEGDVAIGRHVAMGGNALIQGNATIKKNLKVEGWLDAPNIKGSDKGMFNTLTLLRASYPQPSDGWWALVGTSFPLKMYSGRGGQWVDTGVAYAGAQAAGPLQDATAQAKAEEAYTIATQANAEVAVANSAVSRLNETCGTLVDHVMDLQDNSIPALERELSQCVGNIGALDTRVDNVEQSVATRVAELEQNISAVERRCDEVVEFSEVVGAVSILPTGSSGTSTTTGCSVVYSAATQQMLLKSKSGFSTAYYSQWGDSDKFTLASGKVYVCTQENKAYRWDGANLVSIGAERVELGTAAEEAYPGISGAALEARTAALEGSDNSLRGEITQLRSRATILPFHGFVENIEGVSNKSTGIWFVKSDAIKGAHFVFKTPSPIEGLYQDAGDDYCDVESGLYLCMADNMLYSYDNRAGGGMVAVTLDAATAEAMVAAKTGVASLTERVAALERSGSVIEELESEEEWQRRKGAGELEVGKLYFVAEV